MAMPSPRLPFRARLALALALLLGRVDSLLAGMNRARRRVLDRAQRRRSS